MRIVDFAPQEIAPTTSMVISRVAIAEGEADVEHTHPYHQLCWARRGTYVMRTGSVAWHLSPLIALWIPAGTPHSIVATDEMLLLDTKYAPELCPVDWTEPTVVAVPVVVAALLDHLTDPGLPEGARRRAEAVVLDNLRPAAAAPLTLLVPSDERAQTVATGLLRSPACDWPIERWADHVGSSRRTLVRLFRAETGLPFSDWRAAVRLHRAAAMLAAGVPAARAARAVGYRHAGSFTTAFRRAYGTTPSEYAARNPADSWSNPVAGRSA